ncbi:jerky protein homolog-like isoform X1 [Maniola hyperantus]|uniref:jerky protein homolog-like isoform X1 n=2 Tax=Aphantopus hyperantus TaxID=2795564 RepID=UPI0037498A73
MVKMLNRMVNNYKRKTSNASWDENVMKLAMEEARKTSAKGAARKYGISVSTLQRHIKKGCPKKKLGRFTTVFTECQEKDLLKYVFYMKPHFFGLTRIEFLKLVYQYAESNHMSHPFKNGIAGDDWYTGFKMRHPGMRLRQPEPTRAKGFDKSQVQTFFDILEREIEKHNINATRVYNAVETLIQTTSNEAPKILCRSRKKQIATIPSIESGELMTIVCCCNAAGWFTPPFLIGREQIAPRLLDDAPFESKASCTDNGWINGQTFLEWLQHFVDLNGPTERRKIILVLDYHESHKFLPALEFATKNHVILVSFPPNTTHKLQPLDTWVYGPVKSYFEQTISKSHDECIVSKYEVARVFIEAYMEAATVQNAVEAFSSTGIWPTNRHIILNEPDYLPSMTDSDRPGPIENEANEPEFLVVKTENNIEISFTLDQGIPLSIGSDRTVAPSVLDDPLKRNNFVCKTPASAVDFEPMAQHSDNL